MLFRRNSTRRAHLSLEPLDPRLTPAGNVSVSVNVYGDLLITGDGDIAGNTVTVTETAHGTFTVAGDATTRVNGATAAVDTSTLGPVTRDLRLTFGAGPDSITVNGGFLAPAYRDLIINPGGGADTVSAAGLFVRNASVTQPAGTADNDSTALHVAASGNLTVTNQGGADTTLIDSDVAGNLTVTSLDGGDNVQLFGRVGKALKVTDTGGTAGNHVNVRTAVAGPGLIQSLGDGPSSVLLGGATFVGPLTIAYGASAAASSVTNVVDSILQGQFTVTGGAGFDTVTLSGGTARNVSLNLGGGNNSAYLMNDTTVAGTLRYTGGSGTDYLNATAGDNAVMDLVFTGGAGLNEANISGLAARSVTYVGGAGEDTLSAADPGRQTLIAGDVRFTVAAGTSHVSFAGASGADRSAIGGRLIVTGGAGQDHVSLVNTDVFGATTLALAGGNDTVTVDDSRFYGAAAVTTGAGNDVVEVERNPTFTGETEFFGSLMVSVGPGVDTVRISGTDPALSVVLYGPVTGDLTSADTLEIGDNITSVGYPPGF